MNPENRNKIILLGVLVIAVIGVFAYQFGLIGGEEETQAPRTTRADRASQVAAAPRLEQADVDIDTLLREIEVVNFNYEVARIDRNPMNPLVGMVRPGDPTRPATQPAMIEVLRKNVTGIIHDPYNPVAVVDDQVVGLGHTYPNGVLVQAIEPDRVVFRVGDSLIPVELKEL